jgi:hypothetical protein
MTLFGALAWPLATLAIALIFRRDLTLALGRVGQLKYRGLEVTFHEELRQAEEVARSIPSTASVPVPATLAAPRAAIVLEAETGEGPPLVGHLIGGPSPSTEGREALVRLAAISPRDAVEGAWCVVGRALVRMATALGDRKALGLSNPDVAARFLVDRGRLAAPEAMLLGLLRTLRDRAAGLDQIPPSPDEARRFVDLALTFASKIEERG